MNRIALIIDNDIPVDAVALPDGKSGDDWLKENPDAVEVTNLDPQPGLGTGWKYVNGVWIAPIPPTPTHEQIEGVRREAYEIESDPVFFAWQRGEATKEEWLAAVQAVKDAHPYPVTS